MKRQFEGFSVAQQRLTEDPGQEYEEPKVVQARQAPAAYDEYDLVTVGAARPAAPLPPRCRPPPAPRLRESPVGLLRCPWR
jgi:hypothetical protein